jgi:peptidyl-dipeptidase Dcp
MMTSLMALCLPALLSAVDAAAPAAAPASAPSLPAAWSGPYGGVPPFDRIDVAWFKPAFEAAMAERLRAVDRIAGDPTPPTFENTLAALERSGRAFREVSAIFGIWSGSMSTPAFQEVERELSPRLAALEDQITQNEKLFARIDAVASAGQAALTPEQRRLVWLYRTDFIRAGARLDAAGKRRIAEINARMASLSTAFTQHVIDEEGRDPLILEAEADLTGLPESIRSAAAASAAELGKPGRWAIVNTRSAVEPFLTYSGRRDLRERVWRSFVGRCDHGDERDNKQIITEMVALRAERARLLGYPTHAHWKLEHSMARTPERAQALMEAVWPAAVARVRQEVADMQAVADREGARLTIEPWDYWFYAEKVRAARYDFDENAVKPYLELEQLRQGMFWVAGQLLDLHFKPVSGVPVYHPDVRVWLVEDGKGQRVGLWYFDPWARPGKKSGAWMSEYRAQQRLGGEITAIVSNNANFVKGKPGEPVLVSWDDAATLFHEFGHALHGLSSRVTYPALSGTEVARDYVEFPSQLLERWLFTPEVLNRFARHVVTGKAMPMELVKKIERAATFNQGFVTVEYLADALLDMRLHLLGSQPVDPAAFEREALAAIGMPREIALRHRLPHFQHIFSADEDYSVSYYAYLWSDTLSADAYEAFTEGRGLYDKAVARRLFERVLSVGNTVDPADGYRAFRGRDAGTAALMRRRGFPVVGAAAGASAGPAK